MYKKILVVIGMTAICVSVSLAQNSSLQLWSRFNTDNPQVSSDEWLADVINEYSNQFNTPTENTFYPFDQINTTLNIAVQTGTNIPDIAYIDTEQISFFFNNGTLTDLTAFVRNASWSNDIDPASLATCTAPDGAILCIPSSTSHYYLYYWTDTYPDGFPETTDEFLAVAPAIRESGTYPMTFKATEPVSVERFYTGLLTSYGAELAGPDGEATWASEESVQAVRFIRDAFNADYIPSVALAPQFEYEQPFMAGEAGAIVAGTFSYVYLSPLTAPDGTQFEVEITGGFDSNAVAIGAAEATGKIAFAPPLASPGGDPISIISSEAWAIPAGTEDIDEALAFIDFQMTTEQNTRAAIAGGKLPVLMSATSSDAFDTPYWQAALEIRNAYGTAAPKWLDYNSAQRLLSEAIVTVITNPNADIRQELERAQNEYNAFIQ